jgi:MarR family transcriptional regulator, organic hydroperoxide resistance regulator
MAVMSISQGSGEHRANLERALGYDLQEFLSRSDRRTRAFAAARDMSLNDMRALLFVASACGRGETVRAGDFCDEIGLSGAAITYLLDRSAHRGHLRRDADPGDRRKAVITLAEAGVRAVREFATRLHRHRRAHLADLPDEDLEAAIRVIRALIAATGESDATTSDAGDRAQPIIASTSRTSRRAYPASTSSANATR